MVTEVQAGLASGDPARDYRGLIGMLWLAAWLDARGDTSHLGTLFTAFGEKRAALVVQAVTKQALVDAPGQAVKSLDWFHYPLPYAVVKPLADSLDPKSPTYDSELDEQMVFLELEALKSEYGQVEEKSVPAMGGGLNPEQLDEFIDAVNRGEVAVEALAGYVRLTGLTAQLDVILDSLHPQFYTTFEAALDASSAAISQRLRAFRLAAPSN